MKLFLNNLIIAISLLLITSCSSIKNLDISSIIGDAEEWLFEEETTAQENSIEENKEDLSDETIIEEVFPDINSVSQEKPDFEEIDESFFSSDQKQAELVEENETDNTMTIKNNNINKAESVDVSIKKKNIFAIQEIRQNVRLRLAKLLLESDPPVDSNLPVIDESVKEVNTTKVAIIQFPNNSIIPDETADQVLIEILKFKDSKNLKLVGHASKIGSDTTIGKRRNMEISISRAQTIKNMLINKGYDGNKINVTGKGDLEPLLEESKKFGEAVNRRVEVFFISD